MSFYFKEKPSPKQTPEDLNKIKQTTSADELIVHWAVKIHLSDTLISIRKTVTLTVTKTAASLAGEINPVPKNDPHKSNSRYKVIYSITKG